MPQRLVLSLVAMLLLSCAAPAIANTVTASGAGDLPSTAQNLTGDYVTEILGSFPDVPNNENDVYVFEINVLDFADFSAETVPAGPFGIPDTALFLFDASGVGVYMNDDISGDETLSCLPSAGTINLCSSPQPAGIGPASDGVYYLALSESFDYPLSSDGEIFSPVFSTDVVGPGSSNPVGAWDNGASGVDFDLKDFDILVTGTTPEPATWTFFAAGVVFMLLFFRRRLVSL